MTCGATGSAPRRPDPERRTRIPFKINDSRLIEWLSPSDGPAFFLTIEKFRSARPENIA